MLANLCRDFIEVFLCLDRTAEEQFALRILRRKQFLPSTVSSFISPLFIGENDLRLADVNLGRCFRLDKCHRIIQKNSELRDCISP